MKSYDPTYAVQVWDRRRDGQWSIAWVQCSVVGGRWRTTPQRQSFSLVNARLIVDHIKRIQTETVPGFLHYVVYEIIGSTRRILYW